jgi:Protein of unknown function (DUF559)
MAQEENRKRGRASAVEALATPQHGVVSRDQLRAIGLTDKMIASRCAAGAFQPLFRQVFAVGHRAIGRRGYMLAAVLACGDGAVVSHVSAAELLGLWNKRPVVIHVTAPGKRGRRIDGIRWHRSGPLAPDEMTASHRVPCTTVSRTLVDMAGSVGEKSLRRLIEQAAFKRLLDVEEIDRMLDRRRRRGAPMLRRVLVPWRTPLGRRARVRSPMEARMIAASTEAGLPPPRCNFKLTLDGERFEFDFLWEEQRLVIETDGEETHGTPVAFQEDRKRDQILAANGYRSARITWEQMEDEPAATMARLRRILAQAAG